MKLWHRAIAYGHPFGVSAGGGGDLMVKVVSVLETTDDTRQLPVMCFDHGQVSETRVEWI